MEQKLKLIGVSAFIFRIWTSANVDYLSIAVKLLLTLLVQLSYVFLSNLEQSKEVANINLLTIPYTNVNTIS